MSHSSPGRPRSDSRRNSPVFQRLVPVALVVLGLVMLVLILFAVAVLLGLIRY